MDRSKGERKWVFPFADPDTAWYFQVWDVGIDNLHFVSGVRRPTLAGR